MKRSTLVWAVETSLFNDVDVLEGWREIGMGVRKDGGRFSLLGRVGLSVESRRSWN